MADADTFVPIWSWIVCGPIIITGPLSADELTTPACDATGCSASDTRNAACDVTDSSNGSGIETGRAASGLATTACDVTGWSKDEFVCSIGRQQIDGVGSTQPVKQLTTMAHIDPNPYSTLLRCT
jgi:hypothetical protein